MDDGERVGSSGWSGPARVLGVGLSLAVAGVLVAVWWTGRDDAIEERVVTCFTGKVTATCDLPGTDEEIGWRGGKRWFDSEGTMHDHGWPDCLPSGQQSEKVRVGLVDVERGGAGWKAVVWVDCRG